MYRFTVYKRIYKFFYPSIVDDESTTQQKKKKLLSVEESNSKGGEGVGKGRPKKRRRTREKERGREKGRVKVHNDGRMSDQQEVTVEVLLSAHGHLFVFSYPSTFCLVSR